ncbi:uncharacterized protein LOC129619247 [Condylostylus longicornis]|uniref:uncharacterized protein LOC129619247 n=1 Tax=Condylostylus longicornis TaxID=2530218 RepID=UPI00244E4E16|nr:uncharacterized protein LOC129619247 [Condylostylus longicornis]
MYKISILLISFISLCLSYDFKDSAFNEYLIDELKDVNSFSAPGFRFKRDASEEKCSHHKGMQCCKSEKNNPSDFEEIKKFKAECYKEIKGDEDLNIDPFDCESAQKLKQNLICMSECLAKKFNLLNENGELDRAKVIEHLKKKFAEESWKLEKIEEVTDKCLTESNEKPSTEKNDCNGQILKMFHCTWKEFIQHCPKDLQIDSMKCNKLREKISKNDENYLKLAQFHRLVHFFQKEE